MLPNIIGLYSNFPRSGKSTIAKFLVERYGYTKVSFADPLRGICADVLLRMGLSHTAIDYYLNVDKSAIIQGTNVSGRQLMQFTGTQYLRHQLTPDYSAKAWAKTVEDLQAQGCHRIVCDDLRYPNELALLRSYYACTIGITRRVAKPKKWIAPHAIGPIINKIPGLNQLFYPYHCSDNQLKMDDMNFVVPNNGTVEELQYDVVAEVLMLA